MDILMIIVMGMTFSQPFVLRNDKKKIMTSYLSQSFFPLCNGYIISSHKGLWKCPIFIKVEIILNLGEQTVSFYW